LGKSFLLWTHHYQKQILQILHTYTTLLVESWLHILINHQLLSPYYFNFYINHTLNAKNLINTWQKMTYYTVNLTGSNLYVISIVVTSIEAFQLQLCMHAFLMWTQHLWLDHFNVWWWAEIMKIITIQYSQFLGTSSKQLWNVAIRFVTCLSYNRSTDSSKAGYIGIFTKICQLQSRLVKIKKVTLYWNNYIRLYLAKTGTGKPAKPKKLVMI
jgi:hypothetical protein